MPYPNEYSCRLNDPDKYDKFNRKNCAEKHEDKCIDVIYGIKEGTSEIQALRYGIDIWVEDDARAHCESRDGSFEAAKEEKNEGKQHYQCECIKCGHIFESDEHCRDVKCPECSGDCRRVERPGPGRKATQEDIELRTFDITELRVDQGENQKPIIKGYAAVFNVLSEDLGGFREQVAPLSCINTIKNDDIRAAFNHDPNYILGRNRAGTLQLETDDKGVHFEINPPDTQWCRDLQVSINRGDINQCSFKFNAIKDSWENKKDKSIIRTLEEIKLFDISIVTYPAYPQTSVKVRDYLNALSESEKELDGQDAPEEGHVGRLGRKRKLDIAERI